MPTVANADSPSRVKMSRRLTLSTRIHLITQVWTPPGKNTKASPDIVEQGLAGHQSRPAHHALTSSPNANHEAKRGIHPRYRRHRGAPIIVCLDVALRRVSGDDDDSGMIRLPRCRDTNVPDY